ncbi:MAG: hypothetical protein AABX03_01865 [Nanoarchaeota archaeon]
MQPKLLYLEQPIKRYTFEMPKLKLWVESICEGKVLNLFAGKTKLNVDEIRNDLDGEVFANYHMDAFEFINYWILEQKGKFDTVIVDPPYSDRKSMEKYGGRIVSKFRKLKDILPQIVNDNGIVISCGYHSTCLGRSRGFEKEQICLIGHSGSYHDTLVLVERKVANYLL